MTEQQQEQATLYAFGELSPAEEREFIAAVRADPELRKFLHGLQKTLEQLALSTPIVAPPASLKGKLMNRLRSPAAKPSARPAQPAGLPAGLRFLAQSDAGWKPLPVPGAFIKLLSLEPGRGYAVLLGKLDPGTRYPAHTNAGPEDFYIITGDLHVGDQVLGPGDFHHADAGSHHTENYSVEGCTLLAVLTTDDPLVQLAAG
ncbi:MAG TPA: cupin domain-containing protein [Verrucomicrobiae bacterium]|nr:cupin domain-containing protein [Verrucomicrobiae bacterium]